MFTIRTCLAAVICSLPLLAQSFPDAARLLEGQGAIFKTSNTVEYTQQTDMEMSLMGNPMKITTTMLMQFAAPDKFRMESKGAGPAAMIMVFDGRTMWTYMPAQNTFSKSAVPGGNWMDQFNTFANKAPSPSGAKVLRSEVIEIDGRPYDCWVVETKMDPIGVPGATGGEVTGAVSTVWIDKQLGIAQRTTVTGKIQGVPGATATEMKTTTTLHDVKLNAALPDSVFQFTPPEEAKETPDLMATLVGGLSGRPNQGARAGAKPATSVNFTPQAFVPGLHPTARVEPKYPEAAKQAKVQGEVQILATIDPAGSVVATEVLSGAEILRQPAVDAAKLWKFRPVLRDGRAVYAYSDLHIDFTSPDQPAERGAPSLFATARIMELMRAMPRTPQEELADLEQDLGPATGPDGPSIFPRLAKAAIKAGALEKASSYANDMLKADPQSPNYGQLYHDGHAFRGLVALRQGSVALAAQDLLEAGRTPGSPLLNSFGPNITLARELLEKGEKDAVLEYFSRCKSFWKSGADKLDAWSAAVRNGTTPDFGPNGFI